MSELDNRLDHHERRITDGERRTDKLESVVEANTNAIESIGSTLARSILVLRTIASTLKWGGIVLAIGYITMKYGIDPIIFTATGIKQP